MTRPKKAILIKISVNLAVVAAVLVAAVLVARLLSGKIATIGEQIGRNKELSYRLKNRSAVYEVTKKDFSAVDENFELRLNDAIPSIDNVIAFVDAVDSLSKKNSVEHSLRLSSPAILPKEAGKLQLDSFDYFLALNDVNLNSLITYLKEFEDLRYFTGIRSLSISCQGESGWNNNSQVSLNGKLYVRE